MSLRIPLAAAGLVGSIFIALVLAGALDTALGPVVIAAVSVAVAAGVAALFSARLSSAIGKVETTALAITAGHLEARAEVLGFQETDRLVDVFNQMAHALQEQISAAGRERSRLLAALNSTDDAIVAVDDDGAVVFCNAAAERRFGGTREDILGHPFVWVLSQEQVVAALRSAVAQGKPQVQVVESPAHTYLEVTTSPIVGGGEWAALAVFHDVTDVKRTEAMRRDFVANVSHELRTPLASVKAVIETLRMGGAEDEATAQEFLARADAEADRLARLIEELLELSRIESGDLPLSRAPVQIGAVLASAIDRMRSQSERQGIGLELQLEPELSPVLGDSDQLERVAVNLIHNAIKFTPSGGSIKVRAAGDNGRITVTVVDTGQGITQEDLPRVFERFYKADRSRGSAGAGLGLAVAKHIVEAHGGAITVESEFGSGAAFSFCLPVQDGLSAS